MASLHDQTTSEIGYRDEMSSASESSDALELDESDEPHDDDLTEHFDKLEADAHPIDDLRGPDEESAQVAKDRESLRRALRDLEAAEARVKRNAERVYEEARASLVYELLPVLDNLDRAIEAAAASKYPMLAEGVRLVRKQLDDVLARYGAERIDAAGLFDPSNQEAITTVTVSDPRQHMVVVEQLAPGYRFGDRLLRPAKVVVGVYPS